MPVYNLTIDDASPIILYKGDWVDSLQSDPFLSSYANGTFHSTNTSGNASFLFNGTAIYLFGAFRVNHGTYSVSLDNVTTSRKGFGDPFKFQQNMFEQTGLGSGREHSVTLKGPPGGAAPYVDLDYIVVTQGDGNATTISNSKILGDTNDAIQYHPQASWSAMASEQDGSTSHQTNIFNASVTISFHGNAVTLYGSTAPNHGLYEVSLDDAPAQTFNGSASVTRSGEILYLASGLTDGLHRVKMTNVDPAGQWLDFEGVAIFDWSGCCNIQTPIPLSTSTINQDSMTLGQTLFPSPASTPEATLKYVDNFCTIFLEI
ncbi:hypothetical protein PHLGIDRAFT_298614 [Phlebiopsis gigantea 11061_1 CR5-6]|uniref:Uncharacterized protein n=1 Tax=Phlebiopsis gigantea (strain 11061_1 CR5-6) TaxID=745531 RepID=A0A0C3NCX5_PHLG1|nr:hypothetical protein PHLGIDRAFT_298614 [Phlebiopsis gigantea 11061_1 CR5-6]